MNRRMFAPLGTALLSMGALLVLLALMAWTNFEVPAPARAAPLLAVPTVTGVAPSSAPNDLDTSLVVTGTGFTTSNLVLLDDDPLDDVAWVSATVLTATVPWGTDPAVYTVTVFNPGEGSGSRSNAFTVTQGIGVWNAGELYGGDVSQVAVNPLTPTTVYAVSENVGLFRSQDAGGHWSLKVAGSVHNLAIDPTFPQRLYWSGAGRICRSDDGGDTWVPLDTSGEFPFPHPTEPGTVFVSNRWPGESGLWKSENYGATWLTMTTGLTDTRVNNLVFHPTDPLTMYVGTEQGNIFVSPDGGTSWSFVSQPLNTIQKLAINPRGDHELWVSNPCFAQPRVTLKSTNIGHTAWTTVTEPVGTMSLRDIEFTPDAWGNTYSETVFVGGCWGEDRKTVDGGDTWEAFGPENAGWDIALHPTDPDILYTSSFKDGVYKTVDGGATWQVVNQGLTAIVPRHLETVPGQPDVVYAQAGDNGLFKATQGGAVWVPLAAPGDAALLVDPFTPTRLYLGQSSFPDGWVHISNDGGQTWSPGSILTAPALYSNTHSFVNVLQAAPSQRGTLLAGVEHFGMGIPGTHAGNLFRSTDAGEHWSIIDVGQEISPVTDIAFDAVTSTIVYAATGLWDNGSGILRSTNGGQTWQRTGESIAGLNYATSIAMEPSFPYRVFVLGGDGVYVSDNHGISWTKGNVWRGNIAQILCTDDDPSVLYFATDIGLLRSTDGAQSWERAAGTLGRVPIYSLATVTATDRTILYAGTTGGAVEDPSIGSTLVGAGVYRWTSRLLGSRLYLPLVFRD
ncbi:MAG: IPT/TIG domain-containing protein [Chloroflexi bacterium]|nr:IPT/TIG domain-containing protein [Chloroflexota bacterium]